jgi:isopentenyl diphosphate isomerase/L-lactate dehydrogenase-like FMN-dependent dehydrogenase
MSKKNTISVCTGVGLNMFFPEYVTVEIPNKKNTIISDWLEEQGDPKIEKEVGEQLKKITNKRKTKKDV